VEQLHQNDQAQAASVGGLVFEDDEHNTHTLQSLNKMRKNRHFCDVILHVRTAVWSCYGGSGTCLFVVMGHNISCSLFMCKTLGV